MTQLNPLDIDHTSDLLLRDTPLRLSETARWLLAQDDLDGLLRSNSHIFPAFMDRLEQTLDGAFQRHCQLSLLEIHRSLYHLYEDSVGTPRPGSGRNQYHPFIMRVRNEMEGCWEASEQSRVGLMRRDIPGTDEAFLSFMRELCATRSLAKHPLFSFLENRAGYERMVEFFLHEGVLILRFCDLMVLSLLGVDEEIREELAQNLWDEVGNGNYQDRHTELYKRLLHHAGVSPAEMNRLSETLSEKLDWQGLAGYNLYIFFGLHRRNFFKFVGGMGVAEYMDPPQYARILAGCRRVGLTDPDALAYYSGHAELDVDHGEAWFSKVMAPLIRRFPEAKYEMAVGALMRINTTSAYYDALYRKLAGHLDRGS